MKTVTTLFVLVLSLNCAWCQEGITFKVEKLSPPERPLYMIPSDELYKGLIMADADISPGEIEAGKIDFPFDIIAKSEMPDSLVSIGYHSFFNGMYLAYADHRPFVLSPDMIWLLISQGFARHVNANPESLRHHFVDFTEKMTLVVHSTDVSLTDPGSKWETLFPKFTEQLSGNTKDNLIELLSADFSTTTPVEKVASEITIMESMKPYFEFVHIYIVCGIPEITLRGTTADWQKILDKTKQLSRYDLKWWTDELIPLLEEFVKTSEGKIDKAFWRNMFKYHTPKEYGSPKEIDGWIVKFYPYDSKGKRNNLRNILRPIGEERLPEEIVKVDLKHFEISPNGKSEETILELWAGFIGLEQNRKTYALTPRIGWMIKKKDIDNTGLQQKFESRSDDSGGIHIRVEEVPPALLELKAIRDLKIDFIDRIIIPEEMKDIVIQKLTLTGQISSDEIKRIKGMFPHSTLTINRKVILQVN